MLKGTLGSIFGQMPKKASPVKPPRSVTKAREASELPPVPPGVPPHMDWTAIADSFIGEHYNAPERSAHRPQGIFHPSAGLHPEGGACQRQIVFDLLCCPRSATRISPKLSKILENGSNRHKGLNDLFVEMGHVGHMGIVSVEHDIPCSHVWLPLAGEADIRVTVADGWRYVHDFKTINAKGFAAAYAPKDRHRIQLNTYLGMMEERAGYVIYENKDNQTWAGPMHLFRVDYSSSTFAETEAYCNEVMHYYIFDQRLPDFDEAVCKDNITFCSYTDICSKCISDGELWPDFRPEETKRKHLKVLAA